MSLWNAFYGRRVRDASGIVIAILLTATLAGLDLTVGRVNYSVGYLLPLAAVAPLRRRRLLFGTAVFLTFITYAIYYLGPYFRPFDRLPAGFDFRLFNRTLAVIVVLSSAVVLDLRYLRARRAGVRNEIQAPKEVIESLFLPEQLKLSRFVTLNVLAFGLIFLADVIAPERFNIAILYTFVVAVCAYTRRRLLLWIFVLLALGCNRLGFWLGPLQSPPQFVPYFLLNRLVVSACVICIALLTAPWIAWQEMDYGSTIDDVDEGNLEKPLADPRGKASGGANGRLKRILYLDHTAAIGGGEIALLNLLQHLDRNRYEPVVALFADGPLTELLRASGVETHLLPLPHAVVHTRKESLQGWRLALRAGDVFRTLLHAGELARFMRVGRFDLIHSNSLKSDVIGGLAGRLCGQTVLWHVRDRIDSDYLPRQAVVAFRTACCLLADYIVTNSKATLELLRPTYGEIFGNVAARERMRVVHDGVAASAFVESKRVNNQFVVIGLVGRISPFKGQDVFVRAASAVLTRFPNCRFRIIGAALFNEEEYERQVRELVLELQLEEALEFTGFRSDVVEAITELDILVHASVTGEPFGQVIVEGMAAAKPVIATNGGGVPEIVQNGSTGLLVPMGDADALADAICRLMADPVAAAEMGLRGRERVHSHFRIEDTANKVDRFYRYIFWHRHRGAASLRPRTPRTMATTLVTWPIWGGVVIQFAYSVVECVRAFES
jgi:glycosyltransferase involved in cell wall biosynthesis